MPEGPDSYLAKAVDGDVEKPAYSPIERLGLDERREVINGREKESIDLARIPAEIFASGQRNLPAFNAFLAQYGLNSGVYHENYNAGGIRAQSSKSDEALIARVALLNILEVPRYIIISNFFGADAQTVTKDEFSPAFETELNATRVRQREYPLRHSSEFPKIDKYLRQIKEATGFAPFDLFKPEKIPPLYPLSENPALEDYLRVYSVMVSGRLSRQQISERQGQARIVDSLLIGKRTPLSAEAFEKVKEMIGGEADDEKGEDEEAA